MTDREPLSAIMERMRVNLRPHAQSTPVTATRRPGDSKPVGADDYGTRRNTNANRRNGGSGCYYRPKAEDFAGSLPATTRTSAPTVKPSSGIRVSVNRVSAGVSLETARATGADNGVRTWVTARTNLQRDAGDANGRLPGKRERDGYIPGEETALPRENRVTYPDRVSERGNIGPSPLY